jgi:predicted transposase/invertase (TIGR01784 family)
VRFLAILERSLFPDDPDYLSHDKILNIRTHKCRIEAFFYSFLELGKIDKSLEESQTTIDKWAYFFKHATKTTEEELEAISRDYPPVREAYRELEQYNYTKEELEEYNRLDRNVNAIATSISDAEKKGEAKGKAEGKAEIQREMVMSFSQQGVDKNIIATAAHLSLEEVEQILAEGGAAKD